MRERRVGHRDVDVAAAAGALRADERGEQRDRRGGGAAQEVGDLQVAQRGRPAGARRSGRARPHTRGN